MNDEVKPKGFVIWLKQMRADFLVLAVLLTMIGLALAANSGVEFSFLKAALLLVGVVSSHIAVNLLMNTGIIRLRLIFTQRERRSAVAVGTCRKAGRNPGRSSRWNDCSCDLPCNRHIFYARVTLDNCSVCDCWRGFNILLQHRFCPNHAW